MSDFSTLIYLIKNFQNGFNTAPDGGGYEEAESSLLATEGNDLQPSERSVQNILDFANSYEVMETESSGYVELNLN